MAHQISTRSSTLTCLCGAVTEPGSTLVADNFPIPAGLCSCSICRQSTGALGVIPIQLTGRPSAKSLAACKIYTASDRAERYFCSICGSHVFLRHSKVDKWFALAGVIDRNDEARDVDTIKLNKIGFLSETGDGGLAARILSAAVKSSNVFSDVQCYPRMPLSGHAVPLVESEKLWRTTESAQVQSNDKIHCGCHCGKVQFYATRPGRAHNDLASGAKWLRANDTKYVAKLCVCRYCRLATSTPFMPWTYIMPENIFTPDGKAVDFGFNTQLEHLPGAQVYYSSGDSKRSFCNTCGATLFYECKSRPQVVDISMGIVRSEQGVLAEDFLEWDWQNVSWRESGTNSGLLDKLTH